MEASGSLWEALGSLWEACRNVWETFWKLLEIFGKPLESFWEPLGSLWAASGKGFDPKPSKNAGFGPFSGHFGYEHPLGIKYTYDILV